MTTTAATIHHRRRRRRPAGAGAGDVLGGSHGLEPRPTRSGHAGVGTTRHRHPAWAGGWWWPVGNSSPAGPPHRPGRCRRSRRTRPPVAAHDPAQAAPGGRRRQHPGREGLDGPVPDQPLDALAPPLPIGGAHPLRRSSSPPSRSSRRRRRSATTVPASRSAMAVDHLGVGRGPARRSAPRLPGERDAGRRRLPQACRRRPGVERALFVLVRSSVSAVQAPDPARSRSSRRFWSSWSARLSRLASSSAMGSITADRRERSGSSGSGSESSSTAAVRLAASASACASGDATPSSGAVPRLRLGGRARPGALASASARSRTARRGWPGGGRTAPPRRPGRLVGLGCLRGVDTATSVTWRSPRPGLPGRGRSVHGDVEDGGGDLDDLLGLTVPGPGRPRAPGRG